MNLPPNSLRPLVHTCEILLDCFPAIVGRDPDCDIRLRDPWVSRLHCEISRCKGRLLVLDLESTHGTFVNGCRVLFARLMPGDTLLLGDTRFVVEPAGEVLRPLPSRVDTLASTLRADRART